MNSIVTALIVLLLVSRVAYATHEQPNTADNSFYVAGAVLSNKLDTDSYSKTANKNNLAMMIGYRFNNYVAFEGVIENVGEYSPELTGEVISFTISTLNTNLVGLLPVSEKFDLIGSIGFGFYFQSNELNSEGEKVLEHDTGMGQKLGIGFQYRFTNKLSARLSHNLHLTMISNVDSESNRLKQVSSSNLTFKYHFF